MTKLAFVYAYTEDRRGKSREIREIQVVFGDKTAQKGTRTPLRV